MSMRKLSFAWKMWGFAFLGLFVFACQPDAPTCLDDSCANDYLEQVEISEDLVFAQDDPNFLSAVVEKDRLIFTGQGPASLFSYKVGDVLVSSGHNPGFIRRAEQIRIDGDELIVETSEASMFDVVAGNWERRISWNEVSGAPIILDGAGHTVKPLDPKQFAQLQQPLEFTPGAGVSGMIYFTDLDGKLHFNNVKLAITVQQDCDGTPAQCNGGHCNSDSDCKAGFSCKNDNDPDDGEMEGECAYSAGVLSGEFSVSMTGYLQFKPDLVVSTETSWLSVKELEFYFQGKLDLNVEELKFASSISATKGQQWTLGSARWEVPLPIGPIVWPMAVKLSFYTGWELKVEATGEATTGMQVTSEVKLGGLYKKGDGWSLIKEKNFSFSSKPWETTLTGKIAAKLYFKPELLVEIVSHTGVGPSLDLEASLNAVYNFLPERCLEIFFNLAATFKFQAGVLDKVSIDDWSPGPWQLYRKDIYNNCKEKVCKKEKVPGDNSEEIWWWDNTKSALVPADEHGLFSKCEAKDPPMDCCAGECVEFCGTGNLEGLVVDMDDENIKIENAHVVLKDSSGTTKFDDHTPASGVYRVDDLNAGVYSLSITATGYYDYTSSVRIRTDETTYESKLKAIPESCNIDGTVSGVVTDATTGDPLGGVELKFIKTSSGATITTTTTAEDGTGSYKTEPIPVDYYKVKLSKDGYITQTIDNVSVCGKDDDDPDNDDTVQNATLSPIDGHFHVVLQWGNSPKDLDLHATTPDGENIFYRSACTGSRDESPFIALDVDVREGYGPESITITQFQTGGSYSFYVHNYGGQNDDEDSGSLSSSGAKLVVSDQMGEVIREFNVPGSCSAYFWHAFEVSFDADGNPNISAQNSCGGGDNPADFPDSTQCSPP